MRLEIRARVREQREARRVAFRKAIEREAVMEWMMARRRARDALARHAGARFTSTSRIAAPSA